MLLVASRTTQLRGNIDSAADLNTVERKNVGLFSQNEYQHQCLPPTSVTWRHHSVPWAYLPDIDHPDKAFVNLARPRKLSLEEMALMPSCRCVNSTLSAVVFRLLAKVSSVVHQLTAMLLKTMITNRGIARMRRLCHFFETKVHQANPFYFFR